MQSLVVLRTTYLSAHRQNRIYCRMWPYFDEKRNTTDMPGGLLFLCDLYRQDIVKPVLQKQIHVKQSAHMQEYLIYNSAYKDAQVVQLFPVGWFLVKPQPSASRSPIAVHKLHMRFSTCRLSPFPALVRLCDWGSPMGINRKWINWGKKWVGPPSQHIYNESTKNISNLLL